GTDTPSDRSVSPECMSAETPRSSLATAAAAVARRGIGCHGCTGLRALAGRAARCIPRAKLSAIDARQTVQFAVPRRTRNLVPPGGYPESAPDDENDLDRAHRLVARCMRPQRHRAERGPRAALRARLRH